jgi:hypothetical protein
VAPVDEDDGEAELRVKKSQDALISATNSSAAVALMTGLDRVHVHVRAWSPFLRSEAMSKSVTCVSPCCGASYNMRATADPDRLPGGHDDEDWRPAHFL